MGKISILGTGLLTLSMGVYRLFYRTHHDPSFNYPINNGPYHWVIRIILITGGLYPAYSGTRMIIKQTKEEESAFTLNCDFFQQFSRSTHRAGVNVCVANK
jgi:hypothetical protein